MVTTPLLHQQTNIVTLMQQNPGIIWISLENIKHVRMKTLYYYHGAAGY
jgi:hypothetical protein